MKIKILRSSGGSMGRTGHVYLYACATSNNEIYENNAKKIRAIKLNFGTDAPSALSILEYTPHKYIDTDNSIVVESNQSFSVFCKQLLASRYAKNKNFDFDESNCVSSVLFALEAAGIKLGLDLQSPQFKHLAYFIFGYTSIITPKDVMTAVKKYKMQQLSDHINSYDAIANKIRHFIENNTTELAHHSVSLLAVADKIRNSSPDKTQTLAYLLEKTWDLIQKPDENTLDDYNKLIIQIKNRAWSKTKLISFSTFALTLTLSTLLTAMVGIADNQEDDNSKPDDYHSQTTLLLIFSIMGGMTFLSSLGTLGYFGRDRHTSLSYAMQKIANSLPKASNDSDFKTSPIKA